MNDFLALGPELMARLRDCLPSGLHVLSAADLSGVTEERQLTPAVHVVYQGYQVQEASHNGKTARLQQTWLVVVATRNVRGLASGGDARAQAGNLAAGVLQALMGHLLPSAIKPLTLGSAPAARYSAGAQYLPLAFSTELICKPIPT